MSRFLGVHSLSPIVFQSCECRVIGAVAVFADNVEVKKLAEELTGARKSVQALRLQSHEFKNTLHAVAGMIQMERYDDALDCIMQVSESRDKLVNFASSRIRVVPLAALLISKAGVAREQRVDFCIAPDSRLDEIPGCIDVHDVVTAVGNLLEMPWSPPPRMTDQARAGAGCLFCESARLRRESALKVANTGPAIPMMWRGACGSWFHYEPDGHGIVACPGERQG